MKKIAICLVSISLAGQAAAVEYGLGVSVQSGDATVYVPVEINERWRVEGNLRRLDQESGSLEVETLEIGVGAFNLQGINESVRVYYGARLSYVDMETQTGLGIAGGSQDVDGYRFSPTIGFEYFVTDRLSVGGEAEYFFQDLDGDGPDQETNGTDTRLIARYRF